MRQNTVVHAQTDFFGPEVITAEFKENKPLFSCDLQADLLDFAHVQKYVDSKSSEPSPDFRMAVVRSFMTLHFWKEVILKDGGLEKWLDEPRLDLENRTPRECLNSDWPAFAAWMRHLRLYAFKNSPIL